jgi:uncharacterized cupredoxin-like copper-binding protein
MTIRPAWPVVALMFALLLDACGESDDAQTTNTPPSDTAMDEDMAEGMDEEMEGEEMDMDDDHGPFAFGEPADAADADRTVQVTALDTLAFDPATVQVEAGETLTFEVTNDGELVHEFVFGDQALQDEHEEEMKEMVESGEMMMEDEPNGIAVPAGETKEITWHFAEAGELQFACHQPGHYGAGMKGDVDVS